MPVVIPELTLVYPCLEDKKTLEQHFRTLEKIFSSYKTKMRIKGWGNERKKAIAEEFKLKFDDVIKKIEEITRKYPLWFNEKFKKRLDERVKKINNYTLFQFKTSVSTVFKKKDTVLEARFKLKEIELLEQTGEEVEGKFSEKFSEVRQKYIELNNKFGEKFKTFKDNFNLDTEAKKIMKNIRAIKPNLGKCGYKIKKIEGSIINLGQITDQNYFWEVNGIKNKILKFIAEFEYSYNGLKSKIKYGSDKKISDEVSNFKVTFNEARKTLMEFYYACTSCDTSQKFRDELYNGLILSVKYLDSIEVDDTKTEEKEIIDLTTRKKAIISALELSIKINETVVDLDKKMDELEELVENPSMLMRFFRRFKYLFNIIQNKYMPILAQLAFLFGIINSIS
ncbi:MAG: hypothetical protein LBK29_00340 [Oscillospiraceae bacterium]|jgi:hypothetical protein|nr:hypothetical protein [Oscillospiraceae bacterium]